MSKSITPLRYDKHGVPVFPPSLIPLVVSDGTDWRRQLDEVRDAYPFFRIDGDPQLWVTRWQEAREIFSMGELFSSGPAGFAKFGGVVPTPSDAQTSLASDARHREVRRALLPFYSPAHVRSWLPRMREVARELIDRLGDRTECDFVAEIAQYFFPYISAEVLGAPRSDWDQLVQWEHDAFLVPDDMTDRMLHMTTGALGNIFQYLNELMETKRAQRDDGFASFVIGLEEAGVLSPAEAKGSLMIYCLGSGHTVTSTLSYLFHFLATHPAERRSIVASPDAIVPAAEELMRLHSLFGHSREVTEDAEFHGCPVRAGEPVFVMYTMPNRDPLCPGFDTMDLSRWPNPHVGFNFATHQCLGMHWGRQSWQVVVEEWHARIPEYELQPGPLVEQVYAGVGYRSLPLVWG